MPDESIWRAKAKAKALPQHFVNRLEASDTVSEEEKERIVDALKVGMDVPEGPAGKTPTTLVELPPSELPTIGLHYVLWGPGTLSMSEPHPVLRSVLLTEERYVQEARLHVDELVSGGLKDPDPGKKLGMDNVPSSRRERAAAYARWRYRGYLAREITGL